MRISMKDGHITTVQPVSAMEQERMRRLLFQIWPFQIPAVIQNPAHFHDVSRHRTETSSTM